MRLQNPHALVVLWLMIVVLWVINPILGMCVASLAAGITLWRMRHNEQ